MRNYCECYNTAGIILGVRGGMRIKERAQLTIASKPAPESARMATGASTSTNASISMKPCADAPSSNPWPFFVEDPVRTEAFQEDLPILRRMVKVPITAREEWSADLGLRQCTLQIREAAFVNVGHARQADDGVHHCAGAGFVPIGDHRQTADSFDRFALRYAKGVNVVAQELKALAEGLVAICKLFQAFHRCSSVSKFRSNHDRRDRDRALGSSPLPPKPRPSSFTARP